MLFLFLLVLKKKFLFIYLFKMFSKFILIVFLCSFFLGVRKRVVIIIDKVFFYGDVVWSGEIDNI